MKNIQLIRLTLREIERIANIIEDVRIEAEHISEDRLSMTENQRNVIKKIEARNNTSLNELRLKLRDCLEYIAECQNCAQYVSKLDVALSEAAFDIIYERKTEEDFDNQYGK